MEIRKIKKEIPVEIFKVGNKEFKTKKDAEEYILSVKDSVDKRYFKVSYSPDRTEGRGYYKGMLVITSSELGENLVFEFLNKILGSPIVYVMGVSPMPNYVVTEVEVKSYDEAQDLKKEGYIGLGRSTPRERLIVDLGDIDTPQLLDLVVTNTRDKL